MVYLGDDSSSRCSLRLNAKNLCIRIYIRVLVLFWISINRGCHFLSTFHIQHFTIECEMNMKMHTPLICGFELKNTVHKEWNDRQESIKRSVATGESYTCCSDGMALAASR